jgi:hypothetical protein
MAVALTHAPAVQTSLPQGVEPQTPVFEHVCSAVVLAHPPVLPGVQTAPQLFGTTCPVDQVPLAAQVSVVFPEPHWVEPGVHPHAASTQLALQVIVEAS